MDGSLSNDDIAYTNLLTASTRLMLGGLVDPGTDGRYNGYDGQIDDLQIYAGVLEEDQIQFLFGNPGDIVTNDVTPPDTDPVSVTLRLEMYRDQDPYSGDVYYAFPQIQSMSPSPVTTNRLESPNQRFSYENRGAQGSGASSTYISTLDGMIDECTNGFWKLYINKGDESEKLYTFTISISGLTSNLLKNVTLLSPANRATNVSTSPAFTWSGPTGFGSVFVKKYMPPNGANEVNAFLPGNATNWPSAPTLDPGTNRFYVSYTSNDFPNVTFTIPVDSGLHPVSNWVTSATLISSATGEFVVTAGATPAQLINPQRVGGNFQFSFTAQNGRTNAIEARTNLTLGTWVQLTNFVGDGTLKSFTFPTTNPPIRYFRVRTQ